MTVQDRIASGDWPVPCKYDEGQRPTWKKEECDRCWSSHEDATPYCSTEAYKEKLAELK